MYYRESFPTWNICLGIFITLRLVSFALYSNTKLFKCYAVRTVLSTIISSLFCSVALVPSIFAWHNDALVIFPVIECSLRYISYATVFVKVHRKLWSLDPDIVDFAVEPQEDCWVYRYYGNRRFLMYWDRLSEIFVVLLVIFRYLKSIPHWPVCVTVGIFLHVFSFALYSNTKLWKCYPVRTVLPTILSVLYSIALWSPCILALADMLYPRVPEQFKCFIFNKLWK